MFRKNGSGKSYEESLSGKRLKSDQSLVPEPATQAKSYEEFNKKYIADGFNQNTLQYLKRMSNSKKSTCTRYRSPRVPAVGSVFHPPLRVQAAAYERVGDAAVVAVRGDRAHRLE